MIVGKVVLINKDPYHQVIPKTLRVEKIELVTISYNTIYFDVTRTLSSDPKIVDKVARIMESRTQDQDLLVVVLGSE